jgi:hypothetical protein
VYLTLGVLMMRIAQGPIARYYCLAIAILVTLLVGSSRVRILEIRAGLRREQQAHLGA